MRLQGLDVAELLPADGALEGLLSCVNPLVRLQSFPEGERLSAQGAAVRLFARVRPFMLCATSVPDKRLVAKRAFVRPLARMGRDVPFHRLLSFKRSATVRARMRFLFPVRLLVVYEPA